MLLIRNYDLEGYTLGLSMIIQGENLMSLPKFWALNCPIAPKVAEGVVPCVLRESKTHVDKLSWEMCKQEKNSSSTKFIYHYLFTNARVNG